MLRLAKLQQAFQLIEPAGGPDGRAVHVEKGEQHDDGVAALQLEQAKVVGEFTGLEIRPEIAGPDPGVLIPGADAESIGAEARWRERRLLKMNDVPGDFRFHSRSQAGKQKQKQESGKFKVHRVPAARPGSVRSLNERAIKVDRKLNESVAGLPQDLPCRGAPIRASDTSRGARGLNKALEMNTFPPSK